MADSRKISVIIPVLNEREGIGSVLTQLIGLNADEIIVVDGGSVDGTLAYIRREFPSVRCFETITASRAIQMNLGAFNAAGDIFLFLHADTRLPAEGLSLIRKRLSQGISFGGFYKAYDPSNAMLKGYAFVLNLLFLRLLGGFVGTNALFVLRDSFEIIGGFPPVDFMEDALFADRLKQRFRYSISTVPVKVSARRYLRRGVLKQIFTNAYLLLTYKLLRRPPSFGLVRER